jgi:hypothetical protein
MFGNTARLRRKRSALSDQPSAFDCCRLAVGFAGGVYKIVAARKDLDV